MSVHRTSAVDVSVVICVYTHDRWDDILRAVHSAQDQTRPPSAIIVVVDHNPSLLARVSETFNEDETVTVVENAQAQGLSGARNTGVSYASTEVVAFLDDDAAADRQWLANLLPHYAHSSVAGVGGSVHPQWPTATRPAWMPPEFDWVVGCGYVGQPTTVTDVRNFIGANMSLRRNQITESGGFHTGIGRIGKTPLGCEETEICIQIGRRGHANARMVYDPAAAVTHRVTNDRIQFSYYLRRCRAEGISKAAVSRLVGSDRALASERTYVRDTLVRGGIERMRSVLIGPHRITPARQLGALVIGLAATCFGYVRGRALGIDISTMPR